MNNKEKIRTFIAFEIPDYIIYEITKVQDNIKKSGFPMKWVKSENMHLTIKFLGDIYKDDVKNIKAVLVNVLKNYKVMSVSSQGIGIFPNIKRPKVLWVGLNGDINILSDLHKSIDQNLLELGFEKEPRLFKGHLTLARVKNKIDVGKLEKTVDKFSDFKTKEYSLDKLILFQSILKPSGPVYNKLFEIGLN